MKKINYLILILFVSLYSCVDKNAIESKIADCINAELNAHNSYSLNNLDVYDFVDEIEHIVFKEKPLNTNLKELYLNLLNNPDKYRTVEIKNKLDQLFNDGKGFAFVGDLIPAIGGITSNCILKILDSTDVYKMKLIVLEFDMIDQVHLSESALKRTKIVENWVLKIPEKDFQKRFYRFRLATSILPIIIFDE